MDVFKVSYFCIISIYQMVFGDRIENIEIMESKLLVIMRWTSVTIAI
jgi:hypothetical protein